jgi:hypothetical protein
MARGRPSLAKDWSPEFVATIRFSFKKNPLAHSTVFLEGGNLPQLFRAAIEEYAINHNLISADPDTWKKLEIFAFNQFTKKKNATPEAFMQLLEEDSGDATDGDDLLNRVADRSEITPNTTASTKPQTPKIQPTPVVQTPKTRQPIDFGPAETPSPPATESTAEPEEQSTAAEYNRWFKDQDNY